MSGQFTLPEEGTRPAAWPGRPRLHYYAPCGGHIKGQVSANKWKQSLGGHQGVLHADLRQGIGYTLMRLGGQGRTAYTCPMFLCFYKKLK